MAAIHLAAFSTRLRSVLIVSTMANAILPEPMMKLPQLPQPQPRKRSMKRLGIESTAAAGINPAAFQFGPGVQNQINSTEGRQWTKSNLDQRLKPTSRIYGESRRNAGSIGRRWPLHDGEGKPK